MIINGFPYKFKDIESLLKRTPNLKNLTIDAYNNIEMFNAYQWEYLITSKLSYLNSFNFIFRYGNANKDFISKLE